MQRHFQVSPPSVHQVVTLERNGLIRRQPGVARSIEVLVALEDIPILDCLKINQSYHCAEVLVRVEVCSGLRCCCAMPHLTPRTTNSAMHRARWNAQSPVEPPGVIAR
jgi:hypothetical protein